jgi:hypothetical protein
MSRKTERMYATVYLDGENAVEASMSFARALAKLDEVITADGREGLFDTLDVGIERRVTDNRTLMSTRNDAATITEITVSVEAVKVSETTTEKTKE